VPRYLTAYDLAAMRIVKTPELEPYREVILGDWPEGEDHHIWAATCPLHELLGWARVVRGEEGQRRC